MRALSLTEQKEQKVSVSDHQARRELAALGICEPLGETYLAIVERLHCQHKAACEKLGVPCDSFALFAGEVLSAKSEAARDAEQVRLAIVKPLPHYERIGGPVRRYEQYLAPKEL